MIIDLDFTTFEIPDTDATIDVKPLSVEAYQKILKIMASVSGDGMDATQLGLQQLGSPEVATIAKDILPKFTANLKGIRIKQNGTETEATVEDLTKHGAFLQLCFTILIHLFTISGMKKEEGTKIKK